MNDAALANAIAQYLIDEWPEGEFLILSKRYRMARELIGIVGKDQYETGRLAGIHEERERAISAERVALANNSTDTQQAAGFLALPDSGTLRRAVYDVIAGDNYGRTDDELELFLGRSHQSVSARRRELVLGNFIVDSGERRRTRRGTTAIVWRLRADAPTCDSSGTTGSNTPVRPRRGVYPVCFHVNVPTSGCRVCGDVLPTGNVTDGTEVSP